MTTRLRPWLPALAWAGVLFGLSSVPGSAIPPLPGWQLDKLVHGGVYLVLGLLCRRGLRATTALGPVALAVAATALATAYGVTDELHQLLTPRRSCDWRDVVADAAGAALGMSVVQLANALDRRGKITPAV